MRIKLSHIPEEGLHVSFSKGGDWFSQRLRQDDRRDFSLDSIDINCHVEKIREGVRVSGDISTEIGLECCRCLEQFVLPVHTTFTYMFVPDPGNFEDDIELSDESLGVVYYRDDTIDMEDIVVEQIVLQVPVKPLCTASCRGLCSICGINLNIVTCNHQKESIRGPFAQLRDFTIKKGT